MAECEWEDTKSLAQPQSQAAGGSEEWSAPGGGSVWVWRKYGEKLVSAKKQALKRSYFRCVCSRTHTPCPARKRIDRIVAGPGDAQIPSSVTLISRHNHTLARQARAEGAEGGGRCSSCTEEGPAAPPGCWCRGPGAPLQRWGLETWSAQELAREMCSDLVNPTPGPGTPGRTQRSASLRSPPPPPPALTLALPPDVSGTEECGSPQSCGLEPGLCWLGDPEEHWDLDSPEQDADADEVEGTDAEADVDALGETLSVPLRFSSAHPPSPPAVSQKWRLPSMRAFREERRVRSQAFDCPTRGPLDQGLEHASSSLEFDWGAQGQGFEWPTPGSLHHGLEQATGGSSCLDFDWGAQGQGFECGTPGTLESPWELCSGRREGPSMGMLLLGEEGEEEAGAAGGPICKKRKKASEDVPAIWAKLRKMMDARSGKTSPPSPSGTVGESNSSGSQGQGELEVEEAEGPSVGSFRATAFCGRT